MGGGGKKKRWVKGERVSFRSQKNKRRGGKGNMRPATEKGTQLLDPPERGVNKWRREEG